MKAFFTWLVLQCVFARILFGLSVELWRTLHFTGSDSIAYFILPTMLICIGETIVSGVILYSMLDSERKAEHEMRKLEFFAKNPEMRNRGSW